MRQSDKCLPLARLERFSFSKKPNEKVEDKNWIFLIKCELAHSDSQPRDNVSYPRGVAYIRLLTLNLETVVLLFQDYPVEPVGARQHLQL